MNSGERSTTQADLPPTPLLLVILAALGMVGPFSIDTIFPAFSTMSVDLGVSGVALQQLISVYLLAFAVMSLFHGPLSDALGRKPVIIAGGVLYVIASVGCALASNLAVLLVLRAIQGLSAGAGQIVSRAMVRDLFADAQAQRTMSHIAMIFGLAPALAPIVGGWLLLWGDWRSIFWFLVVFGVLLVVAVVLYLPETHPVEKRTPVNVSALFSGLWSVWSEPSGRRLALAGMVNFAGMFLYISSAPMFVVNLLGKGEQDFWILFVPLISGMMAGSWTAGRLAGRMSGRRLASLGYLISLFAGAANLGITLVPATARLPWAVALLPFYTLGVAIAFPILTLAMLELFPNNRGAAASVQSFVALISNAIVAGVLAPLLATSLTTLAIAALTVTTIGWFVWRRHLQLTHQEPPTTPDPQAYEPTDEM